MRACRRASDLILSTMGDAQLCRAYGVTTLSLRADILNVFDDPPFSGPVTTYGTSNFGQITTVNGFARAAQFQARIGW
jgi:hypothetical protein